MTEHCPYSGASRCFEVDGYMGVDRACLPWCFVLILPFLLYLLRHYGIFFSDVDPFFLLYVPARYMPCCKLKYKDVSESTQFILYVTYLCPSGVVVVVATSLAGTASAVSDLAAIGSDCSCGGAIGGVLGQVGMPSGCGESSCLMSKMMSSSVGTREGIIDMLMLFPR